MEILIDFISYIKSQISYFSLPIDSIYSKYSSNKAEIAEIKKGNYSSLKNFNENIRTETISFFESIGKGFKTEQISKCEILITNLTNELTALKADTKNKIKIFRAISLFISVCIIIFIV